MDGICKCDAVYEDECKERQNRDVQFLFLFNDRIAEFICRQDDELMKNERQEQSKFCNKKQSSLPSGDRGL